VTQTTTIDHRYHVRPVTPLGPAETEDSAESWARVARAQAGDVEAFAEMFERYHAHVMRLAASRTGSRLTAEDIASDVFVRVLCAIATFERRSTGQPFAAVLTTITVNMTRDHLKNHHTWRSQPVTGDTLIELAEARAEDVDFGSAIYTHDLRADLETALAALSPRQRRAVRLRYFDGLSEAQAAAVMGVNVPQVKALTARGIRALRRQSELLEVHR
jgi:RNA polymerase sigma-70 factor (ECF subfamily)